MFCCSSWHQPKLPVSSWLSIAVYHWFLHDGWTGGCGAFSLPRAAHRAGEHRLNLPGLHTHTGNCMHPCTKGSLFFLLSRAFGPLPGAALSVFLFLFPHCLVFLAYLFLTFFQRRSPKKKGWRDLAQALLLFETNLVRKKSLHGK